MAFLLADTRSIRLSAMLRLRRFDYVETTNSPKNSNSIVSLEALLKLRQVLKEQPFSAAFSQFFNKTKAKAKPI